MSQAERNSDISQPFVSIIVPTFRRPDVLEETLQALLRVDYSDGLYEIIVIDDGSGDETPEIVASLQQAHPQLLYHAQKNSGVATARNRGARIARGEILIFVDDDIVVQPDLIRQHLETMSEFGDCLVNGHWEFAPALQSALQETPFGRFRIELEQWVKSGLSKTPLQGTCVTPEAVTACNLGLRRDHFWRIGGFDEQFPFAGCEDQEFSLRAAAAGYRFVYNSALRFWHNDHRLTLGQFCERQQRGAITAALLALKYPQRLGHRPLIMENSLIRHEDSARLIAKKLAKRILAMRIVLDQLHRFIGFLERVSPASTLLPRLYWTLCGIYIYRGIREGLNRYAGQQATLKLENETA